VASTCEQLIYPALASPAVARELEVLCLHAKARIVATGVNPGFVMDLLPLCLTGACRDVDQITVERVVDAATRRQPLQAKIGCGQDPAEFQSKLHRGQAGHAGLRESAALVAHALGWPLDAVTEQSEPVIASRDLATEFFAVAAGRTCGIHQRAVGWRDGVERITLDIRMHLAAPDPRDFILIKGRPELRLRMDGGVPGEDATIAALINVVPRLLAAPPGLRLLHELALPVWHGGRPSG